MNQTEGRAAFRSHETWYRITGTLGQGKTPVVLLHGGPGAGHNYLDSYGLLANDGLLNTSGGAFDPILAKEILEVTNGTVTNFSGNGLFKFMPAPNFGGIAGFSYRVRDKDGWSMPATVRITVTDDLALPPLQRLNPNSSQLFRSYLSGKVDPENWATG